MICPFAIVERLTKCTTRRRYGLLQLSYDSITDEIKSCYGCKMSLFVSRACISIEMLKSIENIDLVFCSDGIHVAPEMVLYGTALLERRIPVKLTNNISDEYIIHESSV
jgi:hypothetical protein